MFDVLNKCIQDVQFKSMLINKGRTVYKNAEAIIESRNLFINFSQ